MNLFREAKQLLDKKDNGDELTEEEQGLINTAESFAINLLPKLEPEYDHLPVLEGLEELARLVEQATRGRVEVTHRPHKPFTLVRIQPPLPSKELVREDS